MFNSRSAFIVAVADLPQHADRSSANQSRSSDRHRQGRPRRGAAWRHGDGDIARAAGRAVGDVGSWRRVPVSEPAVPARYTLTFELSGFQTLKRENIVLATGQTLDIDTHAAARVAVRRRSPSAAQAPVVDKQATAVGYVQTTAQLDRRSDFHRPLGRARADAWRPHAGRRRRRQPQEPAVRLRGVRRRRTRRA